MNILTGSNKEKVLICLLNMNCFGIGYFMSGLKKRGLIALAVNLLLLVTGHLVNASRQPLLWAFIFLAGFIAMAVDLWLYLDKHPEERPKINSEKAWLLPAICFAVLVLFYGGFIAYRVAGDRVLDIGIQAYEEDDFQNSFRYLYSADQLYRLSLNPRIVETENTLNEVSVIVAAQSYTSQSRYEDAIACVDKLRDFYPQSPKISFMNDLAIDNLLAWANEMQSSDQYQVSYEAFLTILRDYPDEAEIQMDVIEDAIAENYLEWGEYLSAQADYAGAIEKMEEIASLYPQSAVSADAYQAAAQAHYDLAMELESEEDFTEAYNHILLIQEEYPDYKFMSRVNNEMPDLLIQYGIEQRDEGLLLASIDSFELVADYTYNIDFLSAADEEMQITYLQLADDAGGDGFEVINDAKQLACDGSAVDHPSVDIYPEEQGTALVCGSYNTNSLPEGLGATKPGNFRYVVDYEDVDRRVQSCDYISSAGSRRTLERWQNGEQVTIRYVKTGEVFKTKTFYGSSPESCPYEYWFSSQTEKIWGPGVDNEKIESWLETVLQ